MDPIGDFFIGIGMLIYYGALALAAFYVTALLWAAIDSHFGGATPDDKEEPR